MLADFVALQSMTPAPATKHKSGGSCLGAKRRGHTTIPVPATQEGAYTW